MQIKNIIISIIIGLAVIWAAFYAVFGSTLKNLTVDTTQVVIPVTLPVTSVSSSGTVKPKSSSPTTTQASGYTMIDVQKHNSATTCWSAVNGTVYDLTTWVNAHPGGKAAILMICGKDGSPLFNSQHGDSGKVANILARFKIGALK